MKKLMSLAALGALVAATATATAGDRFFKVAGTSRPSWIRSSLLFSQAPPSPSKAPLAAEPMPMPAAGTPIELYHCVKYVDHSEMAPCAVTKIVQVREPDPCPQLRRQHRHCCDPCACCPPPPKCVSVAICVPACACESVKVSRDGRRIRYDYGKYAVDIRVKKDYIEVDYQD